MNRIAAAAAAVLIIAGVGYFIFFNGSGQGDRVSGEPLRAYVEAQLKEHNVAFEAVTYDSSKDAVVVAKAVAPAGLIPFYDEIKADRVTIKGGDKTAIETVFDLDKNKRAAKSGAGFLLLAEEISVEGLSGAVSSSSLTRALKAPAAGPTTELQEVIADGSITVTLDSGSIKNYAVKPIGRNPFDFAFPEDTGEAGMKAYMAKVGELLSSFQYGGYELKGLNYTIVNPDVNVNMTVESAASSGFEDGRIEWTEFGPFAMKIGGEEVQSELGGEITASIKSMRLDGLDISKLFAALKDGTFLPENPDARPILTDWSPVVGGYKVAEVNVTVPGSGTFTLDELSGTDLETHAGLTLSGTGVLKNLVIPGKALETTAAKPMMDALGAEELRINISGKAKFNEKANVWDVSKFTVDVDKFGTFSTNFRFGGLGFLKDLVGMPSSQLVKSGVTERIMSEMTFGRLVISYKDAGIANYVLNTMAKESGMERGQIVAQYVAQFDAMRAQFGAVPALDQLSQSLSTFMQDPQSLTVSFKPKEPVPLQTISAMGLAAPGQLATTLGMSSKAN